MRLPDTDAVILMTFDAKLREIHALDVPDNVKLTMARSMSVTFVDRLLSNGHSQADAIDLLRSVAVDFHSELNAKE